MNKKIAARWQRAAGTTDAGDSMQLRPFAYHDTTEHISCQCSRSPLLALAGQTRRFAAHDLAAARPAASNGETDTERGAGGAVWVT